MSDRAEERAGRINRYLRMEALPSLRVRMVTAEIRAAEDARESEVVGRIAGLVREMVESVHVIMVPGLYPEGSLRAYMAAEKALLDAVKE